MDWRWRAEAANTMGPGVAISGVGVVPGQKGILAGFTLHTHAGGRAGRLAAVAGWMDSNGVWSEDPEIVARLLSAAAKSHEVVAAEAGRLRDALRMLADPIRRHLSLAGGRRWVTAEPEPAARCLTRQLQEAIRRAARRRDITALQRLEQALAFVGGGHTAGEAALLRQLAESSVGGVERWVALLPAPSPRPEVIEVRLSGLLLFGE